VEKMKFASDEKAQIQKALWEVVKTASMALMKLNEEDLNEEEEQQPRVAKKVEVMPINPSQKTLSMAERIASLRSERPKQTTAPKPMVVNQIKKASLTDDKIKSFAVRIGNEILPKVKDEEYDLRVLFKQSNTWNEIKDAVDNNSIKSIVSSVNELIQDRLDQKYAQEQEQAQLRKKQALLMQKQALLKQAEEQKQLEMVEARKQKLAKSQKNMVMASIIKEMKPFVKAGNMNTINVALQKSATWQNIKTTLGGQTERNAFVSEMIQASGFLNTKSADFQRDVIPPNRDSFSTGVQTNRGVDNFKGKESLPKGYSDDIGSTAPDSPVNKTLNLDRSDSHGRTPATALNNITEVVQSGGSAKVIPDNKGFANNSSPLRTSSEDEELENLWSTEPSDDDVEQASEEEYDDGISEDMDDDDFFGDGEE
jgi:hypothetical protein